MSQVLDLDCHLTLRWRRLEAYMGVDMVLARDVFEAGYNGCTVRVHEQDWSLCCDRRDVHYGSRFLVLCEMRNDMLGCVD